MAALKQEAEFKKNQLEDLRVQITNSTTQLDEASATIQETALSLEAVQDALVELLQRKQDDDDQNDDGRKGVSAIALPLWLL